MPYSKQDLKNLIANGHTAAVLVGVVAATNDLRDTGRMHQSASLLSARWSANELAQQRGTVSNADYLLEKNKVTDALLGMVGELPDGVVEVQLPESFVPISSGSGSSKHTTPSEFWKRLGYVGLIVGILAGGIKILEYLKKPLAGGSIEQTSPDSLLIPPTIPLKPDDNIVFIRGGTFLIGSEDGDRNEEPVHKVTIGDFYLGHTEVTVQEFKEFIDATQYQTTAEDEGWSMAYRSDIGDFVEMNGVDWRDNEEGKPCLNYKHPVVHVSWNDAKAYCAWLSEQTRQPYRLPSEAEWEYAAKNGQKNTKYSWGDTISAGRKVGNIADLSGKGKHKNWNILPHYKDNFVLSAPVGSFEPSDLGLYDMSGNVWEWCEDVYTKKYLMPAQSNKNNIESGFLRVYRGGSWFFDVENCRASCRGNRSQKARRGNLGFRVALSLPKPNSNIID
ncbi:MAG: SUMF1/EgtB/PvdO family nonheme iron enzyme [Saprospiraceae bacterium]